MTGAALRIRFALLVGLLAAVFLCSFLIGRYDLSVGDMLYALAGQMGIVPVTHSPASTVLALRMPRIVGAVLVGAALSVSGAAYQFMFRNPMVSPGILGVSAGAGFGAAIAILWSAPIWLLQGVTFAGGMCAVAVTYIVGVKLCRDGDTTLSIILAGIIVSTLFTSLLSMTKYLADPYDKLPVIVYWLMGSLAAIRPEDLPLPAVLIAGGMLPLVLLRRRINLLSFGDETAQTLGIDVERVRFIVILCATLMTATAVSLSGIIGMVGLVVPHLTRFLVGADARRLLPASALLGVLLLLLADDFSRSLWTMELPIGILTSLVGVPFFLYLLIRHHRRLR